MLGKDEKQTFVSIDFMTQKSSKHPSTSLDQNEHAFNFVGDVNFAACQCDTATGSKKKGGQFGCGERLGFGLTLNRFCPTMPADPGGPIPALSSPLSSPARGMTNSALGSVFLPFRGARSDAQGTVWFDRPGERRSGRLDDRARSAEPVALGSLGCRQAGNPLPERSTLEHPAHQGCRSEE